MTGVPAPPRGPRRALGSCTAPAVGFGAMVLAGAYGGIDDDGASRALAAAVDAGCTFVDTSDAYGRNEEQIGRFLVGRDRAEIQVSTKFGMRIPEGEPAHALATPWSGGRLRVNAEPRLVRGYLERSLARLGTDHVDVYSPHFPDPSVPIEETVGAMVPLQEAGLVRHLGLSNPSAEDLARAQTVARIDAVQVEWSMWHPIDRALLARCDATGVGVVAWSPLGRGFLTGTLTEVREGDFRAHVERLTGTNLTTNNERYAPIQGLAAEIGVTPAQLALAWLLHQRATVVPIPGSRTPAHIRENAAAADVRLDGVLRARVDAALGAFVPAGEVS